MHICIYKHTNNSQSPWTPAPGFSVPGSVACFFIASNAKVDLMVYVYVYESLRTVIALKVEDELETIFRTLEYDSDDARG